MPKVIDAKSWQLTPAADGRRYSKYADGNTPTTLASWNLPATINVPAGTSVGVRQYTADATGWTIAVTALATGLTYNSGTESIDAAVTTAASGTATFTLSKIGETDVVATTTVALTVLAQPDAVMDTKFAGALSLVQTINGPNDESYYISGTDSSTGQVFNQTSPQIWGSTRVHPMLQTLSSATRTPNVKPSELWNIDFATGLASNGPDGSGTGLRVSTNQSYLLPDQVWYRIRTDATWQNQGMFYSRLKIKFDADWPTHNHWFVFWETKVNGAGESAPRVAVNMVRDSGTWYLQCSATTGSGQNTDVWLNATSDPPYDSKYLGSYLFNKGVAVDGDGLSPPEFGKWWTVEIACRLQDSNDAVLGNTGSGWFWVSTSQGTETAAAANGAGTQRFYVTGRNCHQAFSNTAPSGAAVIFPFGYYSNAGVGAVGKDVVIGSAEVYDEWPADASSHPGGAT